MPRYQVTLDGKTFVVEGDRPPNEAEARAALSSYKPPEPAAAPEQAASSEMPGMSGLRDFMNAVVNAAYKSSPLSSLEYAYKHPVQAGAAIGGVAAAPFSGGASLIPAMAASGLGAAGGAGLGSIVSAAMGREDTPATATDVAKTMATEGALGAAGEGMGRAVAAMGRPLMRGAVSAYERMLKPNKAALEGMTGMGKTLQERSANVARELLNDPNGQISKAGANRFADATAGIQQQVDDLVTANPEARGSTRHLADELNARRGTFGNQWAPGGDTRAYNAVADEVLNNPKVTKILRAVKDTSVEQALGMAPNASEVVEAGRTMIPRVTARTARNLTQGTYRNLGDKAYGELQGAATEAHKAAARGGRAILNEAIPAVEPLNNAISKRIDLGDVLDNAVFRSGKHDPIGLTQQVVMSGAKPWLMPLSLLNRPGMGSPIARGMNTVGKALEKTGQIAAPTLKAALLSRLFGMGEDEQ